MHSRPVFSLPIGRGRETRFGKRRRTGHGCPISSRLSALWLWMPGAACLPLNPPGRTSRSCQCDSRLTSCQSSRGGLDIVLLCVRQRNRRADAYKHGPALLRSDEKRARMRKCAGQVSSDGPPSGRAVPPAQASPCRGSRGFPGPARAFLSDFPSGHPKRQQKPYGFNDNTVCRGWSVPVLWRRHGNLAA